MGPQVYQLTVFPCRGIKGSLVSVKLLCTFKTFLASFRGLYHRARPSGWIASWHKPGKQQKDILCTSYFYKMKSEWKRWSTKSREIKSQRESMIISPFDRGGEANWIWYLSTRRSLCVPRRLWCGYDMEMDGGNCTFRWCHEKTPASWLWCLNGPYRKATQKAAERCGIYGTT